MTTISKIGHSYNILALRLPEETAMVEITRIVNVMVQEVCADLDEPHPDVCICGIILGLLHSLGEPGSAQLKESLKHML